jgi:3-dehydroquinate synthase
MVLIDPDVLTTLPEREFRAGLFEVIKCGVIRDAELFAMLESQASDVLAMRKDLVDELIAAAVRIKAEVVTADEREGDLRRILNFGHTIGHAVEAETAYVRMLHGEAVAWGMLAATTLAESIGALKPADAARIARTIRHYGPLPPVSDLNPDNLLARLAGDKKTMRGTVHFVLPTRIGEVKIQSGIPQAVIRKAIVESFQ